MRRCCIAPRKVSSKCLLILLAPTGHFIASLKRCGSHLACLKSLVFGKDVTDDLSLYTVLHRILRCLDDIKKVYQDHVAKGTDKVFQSESLELMLGLMESISFIVVMGLKLEQELQQQEDVCDNGSTHAFRLA